MSAHRRLADGDDPERRWLAGVGPGAVAGCAEGTRRKPTLPRIQQRQRQVTGCPESTTASTGAAGGDRASAEMTLQHTGGGTMVVFVSWEGAELVGGPGRGLQLL